ncbi:MAG: hypothetical protein SCJ94_10540 [Bacillota bacterium]|nr:hypothetical protein [Bacillota bacterium]
MGKFLKEEKKRYCSMIKTTPIFSKEAKRGGVYKGEDRIYCLPRELSAENLFTGIRNEAINYFSSFEIKWHDAINRKPSNHLCDSQVCCVNFLYPFMEQPEALKDLLKTIFPDIRRVLPMGSETGYITFEWIGLENYLGEKISRNGIRTRGANYTSTDAAVRFERNDGIVQIVLIEWKYTESYFSTPLMIAKSGTDRTEIYAPLFLKADCPLDKSLVGDFANLFYEPFYQLMRQQFLAHEMEKAGELDATKVSVLHLAPGANKDFRRVTSPGLKQHGDSAVDVWKKIVIGDDRFISQNIEDFFGALPIENHPVLKSWWDYITERYTWVVQGGKD